MLEGVCRTFIAGPDGRQLTLRYVRPPGVVTTASAAIGLTPVPVGVHAVNRVAVLELNVAQLRELFAGDNRVGFAFANELSRRLADVYRSFSAAFFGSVRERLAAHLLQAADTLPGGALFAEVTQIELAEALGSAREVVGRGLRELQREDLVEVKRGGVEILDQNGLLRNAGQLGWPARVYATDGSGHADSSYDALPQPVIGIDRWGHIIYGNAAVAGTFGISSGEIVGRELDAFLDTDAVSALRAVYAEFEADPMPRPIALTTGLTGRGTNGATFPVEITAVPVRRRESLLVFATVVDVSYRRALAEIVARRRSAPTAAEQDLPIEAFARPEA